jgi:beta-galactosidase
MLPLIHAENRWPLAARNPAPSKMKKFPFRFAFVIVALLASCTSTPPTVRPAHTSPRFTQSFDSAWLFLKSDALGAEQPAFADAAWRKLDVPHDWSIEGPFASSNPTGGAGAFLPAGVGWYRKHFSLPADFAARRVFIEFDGVMANSDVWINGFNLGHRPCGYVSFQYELTGHLYFGGPDNVLAVRADTSAQPASRYYFGAGIYRHVRLVATDPVHIAHWGAFVTTPQVSAAQATVHVQCAVTNQSGSPRAISVSISLLAPDGKNAGSAETKWLNLAAGDSAQFDQDIIVQNPQRWDLDNPVLYRARVVVLPFPPPRAPEVITLGRVSFPPGGALDEEVIPFGIREAKFEADTGFWLNGNNLKIKGVCLHQDAGAFGIAIPPAVWEQRLAALKLLGANAIRTAHNPPDPEFLNVCDRMGFLVMDEMFDCWTVAKSRYDYHLYFNDWSLTDTRDTVRRDRNHPGIILYSAGNEIHDTPNAALSKKILAGLVRVFHENDPSRPVTQALFRPNVSHDYDNGLADLLDVIGTNYRDNELLEAHRQKPSRKIIGTENHHDRGAWLYVRDNAPYAGQFLWSGIDYLGEAGRWPVMAAGSGLLDRTGAPKPMAAERQSWWSARPMVFISRRSAPGAPSPADPGYEPAAQNVLRRPQVLFDDWTPQNSAPHQENVEVYANCEEVELFLNGKSLGSQKLHDDAAPRLWKVDFAPGTLRAVAKNHGLAVAQSRLRTAGPPAKIQLAATASTIAAGWDDVCRVTATVVDKDGQPVPAANNLITFKLSGPGVIAAVDNADNASHEPFQAAERRAFQSRCVAFLKATAPSGKITLTASAPGLTAATLALQASPTPPP